MPKCTIIHDCDNNYSVEELYEIFGMDDKETKKCLKCNNHRIEGGIITCKYILEGIDEGDK